MKDLSNKYIWIGFYENHLCARDLTGDKDHRFDTDLAKGARSYKRLVSAWNALENAWTPELSFDETRAFIEDHGVPTNFFVRY